MEALVQQLQPEGCLEAPPAECLGARPGQECLAPRPLPQPRLVCNVELLGEHRSLFLRRFVWSSSSLPCQGWGTLWGTGSSHSTGAGLSHFNPLPPSSLTHPPPHPPAGQWRLVWDPLFGPQPRGPLLHPTAAPDTWGHLWGARTGGPEAGGPFWCLPRPCRLGGPVLHPRPRVPGRSIRLSSSSCCRGTVWGS